jgi:flagellar hook-length control protein FliK
LPVEASARSQEGLAAAALAASTISGITPTSSNPGDNPTAAIEVPANVAAVAMSSGQASLSTSLSDTNNAQSAELATENMAQTGNVETGNLDTGSIENGISVTGTGEAVNNARGISSANSLAADSADAESGVNNNMGTKPVPDTMNINSPTDDGAVAQSPDIASKPAGSPLQDSQPEVSTNAPDVADGEGAEVPSGSNPALSSLTNSASTDTESESGSTTPTNSGSSAGNSHEQSMGTDPSVQSEGITVDRGQGPETRASLDAPISPIVANSASASAATSVTLGTGSALPTAEPKAPAPVSTQMSAHLTTFKGLADGTYETTLRLYPEELGQVSVRIQVNGGTVSIHAFGASDMAVQALREAMPDLRQDLLRSGLDLVDSQVDQGSAFLGNEQESSSGRMVDSENPDRPVSQRNGEVNGADMETLTSIDPSRGGRVDVRV